MPAVIDYKTHLLNLTKERYPEVKVYVPPAPTTMRFFEHFLPEWIAADEPDIRVEYDYSPAEKQTRDYPGCDEDVDVFAVVGITRPLTDEEIDAVFADKNFITNLECKAIDEEHDREIRALERDDDWKQRREDLGRFVSAEARENPLFATARDIFSEA